MAGPVAEMAISSELRLRVLSSAVLAPVALLVVWLGGLFLLIALLLVTGLLAREWVGLVTTPGGVSLVALLAAAGLVAAHFGIVQWALVGLVVSGLGLALVAPGSISARGLAGLGPLYIGGACIAFLMLRAVPESGVVLIVWLLAVISATDIGAYFAGRSIGGRKLAPAISPGKTWAGLFGGMIAAAAVGTAIATVSAILPPLAASVGAAVLAVVAQLGDLFESWLKRRAGVKDSGDLIPGHGGLLDRVDGIMTTVPVMAIAFLTVMG
jgi:phosphatidate cytidylyltransferase